jgi:mannose/fructose/N-acetylgalactosamine-specific phosphotransferase system component IIB
MSIELFRVDERLIHGQVIVGWGERLNADRIVVVDDEIAGSTWEQELYCLGVPSTMEASFRSIHDARAELGAWRRDTRRTIVLVRSIPVLEAVAAGGMLEGLEINLGGLHHAPGRDRALPYLFLDATDRSSLEKLGDAGLQVSARDLPTSRRVGLDELLEGG